MKPAHIHEAIHKASHETSRVASASMRKEAAKSGWSRDVVKNTKVLYDNNEFGVHVKEEHYAAALDHEYGTPDSRPTAAVRRMSNRTDHLENFLVNRIYKHIEDHL
jgi:formylmethanofuran:tetrahydromethanopterin formyltransferase